MSLRKLQSLFAKDVARLILKAYELGYELTFGEASRSDEQAEINAIGPGGREEVATRIEGAYPALAAKVRNNGKASGIRESLHELKLAVDLNLFKDGAYLATTEDHRLLGEWWESQSDLHKWGGRFNDGNHYSITYGGRK